MEMGAFDLIIQINNSVVDLKYAIEDLMISVYVFAGVYALFGLVNFVWRVAKNVKGK